MEGRAGARKRGSRHAAALAPAVVAAMLLIACGRGEGATAPAPEVTLLTVTPAARTPSPTPPPPPPTMPLRTPEPTLPPPTPTSPPPPAATATQPPPTASPTSPPLATRAPAPPTPAASSLYRSPRSLVDGKPRPDHAAGLRVWTDGDSTSYFMSVAFLDTMRQLDAVQVQPAPEYKVSSGLSTPQFFDWPAYLEEQMRIFAPEVVVFMVGANDAANAVDSTTYRALVAATMDRLQAPGRYVLWVGQPTMGLQRPDVRANVPRLNAIMAEEAASRPWVIYVDAFAATAGPDGDFAAYLPDEHGVPQLARADDGVHFTPAGGRLLARAVVAALFGFE